MHSQFRRKLGADLAAAVAAMPQLLHIVLGPRQVGKTTAALQVARDFDGPHHYAAADELSPPSAVWLEQQWTAGRRLATAQQPALLVLDEVQKVPHWSAVVKGLWDADRRAGLPLRVVLLGSSALLLTSGATESMAGRYLLHRAPHWTLAECKAAFGWDMEQWLYFGGYPGAAALVADEGQWRAYVRDALIEPAIGRDVLALHTVAKPALMRQLFGAACRTPAQVVAYTKLLGQLVEAGNTSTLAHYLALLATAHLCSGLDKFAQGQLALRGSSPKLIVWNNALVSAVVGRTQAAAQADPSWRGRLVENAVGAHLLQQLTPLGWQVQWWRDGNAEVDFVLSGPDAAVWAIEVKSGRDGGVPGMAAFLRRYPRARGFVVGTGGMALEAFFEAELGAVFG